MHVNPSDSHHFSASNPAEACAQGPSPSIEPFGHEAFPKPLSRPLDKHLCPPEGGFERAETHRVLGSGHGDTGLGIVLPARNQIAIFWISPKKKSCG